MAHFVTKPKRPETKESTASNHGNSSSTASDDPSILSFTEHVSSVQQKTQYRPPARRMRENCISSAKSVSPIDGNLASSRAKDQIEAETTARHSSRSIIPMWKHKHTTLDIQSSAASYMYARGKTLRINYSVNLRQAWMIGQIDRVISQQELLRLRYFVRVHQMGSNATFFHIACRERGYIVRETCQAREPTAGEQ